MTIEGCEKTFQLVAFDEVARPRREHCGRRRPHDRQQLMEQLGATRGVAALDHLVKAVEQDIESAPLEMLPQEVAREISVIALPEAPSKHHGHVQAVAECP